MTTSFALPWCYWWLSRPKADTAYVPLLPVSSFNFVSKTHRLTGPAFRYPLHTGQRVSWPIMTRVWIVVLPDKVIPQHNALNQEGQ